MTQTKDVKDAQAQVEAAERALKACQEWLQALEDEQASMEEHLRSAALKAAETPGGSFAASGLLEALARREALPWLLWAARVRVLRLQIEHRDARVHLLQLRVEKVQEELHRDPANQPLQRRREDLDLERRMAQVAGHGLEASLRQLEEAGGEALRK